jgi:D-beta-D-heptose 7-phosphate kinase/D-beta-D-heptose 1-phosphate adenosyltransferase
VNGKLVSPEELGRLGRALRAHGMRLVFTNGCFDVLHVGHTRFLREARSIGDALVVAVNTDDSVQRIKGEGRPVVAQSDRIEVLAALESVDYIVLFDESTPVKLIEALRPHVACKGGDYDEATELPEAAAVVRCGGEFRVLGYTPHRSSTELIGRAVERVQHAASR